MIEQLGIDGLVPPDDDDVDIRDEFIAPGGRPYSDSIRSAEPSVGHSIRRCRNPVQIPRARN